jgi:hypothetical protein
MIHWRDQLFKRTHICWARSRYRRPMAGASPSLATFTCRVHYYVITVEPVLRAVDRTATTKSQLLHVPNSLGRGGRGRDESELCAKFQVINIKKKNVMVTFQNDELPVSIYLYTKRRFKHVNTEMCI